jgi:hypothetical protein
MAGVLAAEPSGEAAVRSTLDSWLTAQNQGKFEAYAALYASKFSGIKRSGPRARRMAREAWLVDRKSMFKKKMKVEMSNLVISLAASAANVSFTQRWASGTYKDEGPKRMLLVLEGNQYRIAQEEMLTSKIDGEYVASERAMLLLDGAIVLTGKVDPAWGTGRATADASYVGHRAVEAARLPEAFRALGGKAVEVFDTKGKRCTATVGRFELQARATWHFGMIEQWKEAAQADIAKDVWRQAPSMLVAHLDALKGGCGDLVFGRLVGSSTAPVVLFKKVDAALVPRARTKLVEAMAEKAKGEDLSRVEDFLLAENVSDATRSLLGISFDPELCTPDPSLSSETFWRVDLSKTPADFTVLSQGDSDVRTPLLAVDLDGDGDLEIIYRGWPREPVGILKLGKGALQRWFVEVPYYDCPC